MLYPTKMKVKVSRYCKPKSPEHAVALWSPRHQHHLNPARTDFSVRSTSLLFICLSDPSICLCLDLLINTQVWKQVCLLDLAQLADQGGLGCYGAIGGPDFPPTYSSSVVENKMMKDPPNIFS